jgi:potassium efflux system protein
LLMGLSVNTFLQPASPAGFRMSVAIVSVPVALRVLRTLLPAGLTIVLYGFAVLAVSDLVRLLVAELELLSRVLQVTELAVAFAAVIWLRRSQRFEELVGHTIWLRLVRGWLHLAALGLGAGVLATSLGYMYLANRLSLGIIWGSWFALLLFAAVRIAEAVLTSIVSAGTLDRVRMIRRHPDLFLALARRGLRGVATITWVYIVLRAGFLWEPVRDRIAAALSTELGYATMTFSLGSMLAFVLTLWASWLLARLLSFTLNEEVFPRVRMPPGVPFALATFARYTVLVIGFVAAIGTLGFSLDRVTLLLSALGVGIGFGLQNVVNNFVSGVMLLFERPIRVGDRVELEGLLGDVTSIGIRASKVRTFDGADVIVPNADFISARVTNWTLADRKRRLIMPVGVAYGTNPRRVIEILERVAKSHPEILPHPEPVAVFRGFGDSSLDFEIRAWTESDRGWIAVQSDLAVATNDAFAEAGIEIPFPQRDLHLKSVAPEVRQEVRPEVSPVAADTSETEPLPMPRRRSGE